MIKLSRVWETHFHGLSENNNLKVSPSPPIHMVIDLMREYLSSKDISANLSKNMIEDFRSKEVLKILMVGKADQKWVVRHYKSKEFH